MARRSWQTYQTLLGLPGEPVEYFDEYYVSDEGAGASNRDSPTDGRPAFAKLERELLEDLAPRPKDFPPRSHPFGARTVRGTSRMMFNISAYARMLVSDFLASGGKIEVVEFRSPADLHALRQKTIINATGYGARALFGDESVVPVRGQLTRMIPQPDIHYGLVYRNVSFVPRRDGLVFQAMGENDYYGFGDDTTVPDRAEAERAVKTIASLYA